MKMIPALVLSALAALTLRAGAPDYLNDDPAIRHSVVEQAGPGMPRADSATVVEYPDGTLAVFYQKFREGGSAHDHALSRVWSRVSRDRGRTWVEPRMLVDSLPGDINVGMPATLLLPSGDLLMACLRTHNPSSSTMCLFRSRDQGRTFAEEAPVWSRSNGIFLQGGAPGLVQLKSGRILLPFTYGPPHGDTRKLGSACFVSDDQGRSWRRPAANLQLPRRGADEPSIAELEDGRLVMAIRTQLGGPYLSRSSDRGETWSAPEPAGWTPTGGVPLHGCESCICLRRIPGTNALLILWNDSEYVPQATHGHFGKRTPLTAALSVDGGDSWKIIGNLASGPDDELTNINCTFTAKNEAVITYMAAHLGTPWPKPSPHNTYCLRADLVNPSWWQRALADARAAAAAGPAAYHVPGSDAP